MGEGCGRFQPGFFLETRKIIFLLPVPKCCDIATYEKAGENMNGKEVINHMDHVVVSGSVLGDMLGVSERYIRMLAEQGILIRTGRGKYNLKQSITNYIIQLKAENAAKENVPGANCDELEDLSTEKAKHEHVKRQIAELKLALMKGQVHTSEAVEKNVSDMLENFKTKLLGVPARLSTMLAHKDEIVINKTLTEYMHDCLMELSEYRPADYIDDSYIDLVGEEEWDE